MVLRKPPSSFVVIVMAVCWLFGMSHPGYSQESVQEMNELYQRLKEDQPHASQVLLRKVKNGVQWLEHLHTLEKNLQKEKTEEVVDLVTYWNQIKRQQTPSTLLTYDALQVRDKIALNATSANALQEHLESLNELKKELVYELEALDRIERFRRRDLIITIEAGEGNAISNAKIELNQIRHQFLFGCNIYRWRDENSEKQLLYRKHFADLLNYATIGFYWASYEPEKGETLEDLRQQCARWCRANDITPKGHPLVWNHSDPPWLPEDPQEVYELQLGRVEREILNFKGLIHIWDVVNEITTFNRKDFLERSPKLTKMWDQYGQMEFPKRAFLKAREANPNAILILNDYYIKSREEAEQDGSLKRNGGTIYEDVINALMGENGKRLYDVIGVQSHMHGGAWSTKHILEVIDRFSVFNVPLHFTETTIVSGGRKENREWGKTTREGERIQAEEVERFYRTVFSRPEVEALTWWDFSDDRSWQGAPSGLVRKDMSPKPAYKRLMSLIKNEWWTNKNAEIQQDSYHTRGYMGEYYLHVTLENGKEATKRFVLNQGKKAMDIKIVIE